MALLLSLGCLGNPLLKEKRLFCHLPSRIYTRFLTLPLEELRIKSIEALELEVLNRKLGKYFPKMKKVWWPKRILLHGEAKKEPQG